MTIRPEEIALWQGCVGKREQRTEAIDAPSLRRYAAVLGEPLDVERHLPSLAHRICFVPVDPGALGRDGHPTHGGLLPPISLPRRMFAGAEIRFEAPLQVGVEATRSSRILAVDHKMGGSGELVLVAVEHRIAQDGGTCVTERQTIVYRHDDAPVQPVAEHASPADHDGELWTPGSVDLFRFSAATFNSHRIHYDHPYATREEGYPGLLVHGPFTAARLFGLARRHGQPTHFSFRARAPLFADQPVRLVDAGEGMVRAVRRDGVTAMEATADY